MHEDDPERAVRAGLRLIEDLEGLTRPDGICLMVFTTRKAPELDAAGLQAMFTEFQDFGS